MTHFSSREDNVPLHFERRFCMKCEQSWAAVFSFIPPPTLCPYCGDDSQPPLGPGGTE